MLPLAIARGELSPSADQELRIDLLIGPLWLRLLLANDPITPEYVDSNVQAALAAFDVQPPPGR